MSEPSFIPERDPDTIYGSMSPLDKANAQIQHELETEPAPEGWEGVGFINGPQPEPPKDYQPKYKIPEAIRPHPPRILLISIATEPTGGFQLATQLKFNDMSSPTQATAILDTIEELNNRLSAALGYCPI